MKSLKITSMICGGLISLAGNGLLAQQSSSSSGAATQPSASNLDQDHSLSTTGSSLGGSRWGHEGKSARLSEILNAPVQTRDGKTVGYVRDLTIDPQSGHVRFAILSLSNVEAGKASSSTTTATPGIASTAETSAYSATGKLFPVPWQLFSQSWNDQRTTGTTATTGMHPLVLNLEESKLGSAPSFDGSNWSELHQPSFDQQVYSYFGVNRMSGAGTSGSSISGQGAGSIQDQQNRSGAKDKDNDLPK